MKSLLRKVLLKKTNAKRLDFVQVGWSLAKNEGPRLQNGKD